MTCHRVIGDRCIWFQVWNVSNGVFNRKYFIEKGKRIEKVAFLYKWKTYKKLLSDSGLKVFCAHLHHVPDNFLRATKLCAQRWFCSNNSLKRNGK